jgi:hypothetical protein
MTSGVGRPQSAELRRGKEIAERRTADRRQGHRDPFIPSGQCTSPGVPSGGKETQPPTCEQRFSGIRGLFGQNSTVPGEPLLTEILNTQLTIGYSGRFAVSWGSVMHGRDTSHLGPDGVAHSSLLLPFFRMARAPSGSGAHSASGEAEWLLLPHRCQDSRQPGTPIRRALRGQPLGQLSVPAGEAGAGRLEAVKHVDGDRLNLADLCAGITHLPLPHMAGFADFGSSYAERARIRSVYKTRIEWRQRTPKITGASSQSWSIP